MKKNYIWKKCGKHGAKKQEHGAKKQELFNCLLFHFSHVSYVSHLVTFFRILKTQFSIFSNAFSKRIFRFFQKTVKKCEEGAFWKCTWKKCEKCVLKMHLEKMWKIVGKWEKRTFEIQLGRWTSDFFFRFDLFGPSFAAVTLLPAQLLQVENQRESIGSGLCRSQICLISL